MEETLFAVDAGVNMEEWASFRTYHELNDWREDLGLLERLYACIEAQKEAVASGDPSMFRPAAGALDAVSEPALRTILASGRNVHGISSDRHISNVVVFNGSNIKDSIRSKDVLALRRRVDEAVKEKVRRGFRAPYELTVACSGHLWYPPGGYMGWHTNSGAPGWRMYLSYAEKPGKSFFRYRDPVTHDIVTSWDDRWNIRLFEIRADIPLWHAVYSETHRFSVGYVLYRDSLPLWAMWKCKEVVKACLARM
jgi:hypothetical protein